jgi:hypothetical protein
LEEHAEDVFGEPAFGDAAVADGVDAYAEPLGVLTGRRVVEEGADVVPLLLKRTMTFSPCAMSSWISRCMSAKAPAALAAVNRLNASLPS